MNAVMTIQPKIDPQTLEKVLLKGDLASLNESQRISYYKSVCESVGLNPLTKPFEYISLNNKLTLYATKSCTDQLRMVHRISIAITARDMKDGVYIVTARASGPDGRHDESTGAVSVSHLKGDALANALMKAETKAKRRVTLSISGLAILDETEIETIPSAKPYQAKPEAITATISSPAADSMVEAISPPPKRPEAVLGPAAGPSIANTVVDYGLEKGKTFNWADLERLWATWGWIIKEDKRSAGAALFVEDFKKYLQFKGLEPNETTALEAHKAHTGFYNRAKAAQESRHFKDKEPEQDLPY
jgi:hypothetical protein